MSVLKHMMNTVIGMTVETRKGHPVVITDAKVENNRVYVKANDQWMRASNLTIPEGTIVQNETISTPQPKSYEFKFAVGTVLMHDTDVGRLGRVHHTVAKQMVDANNPYLGYYLFDGLNDIFYAPRIEEFYTEIT